MSEGPRQRFGLAAFEARYVATLELDDARILARPVHVDDVGKIGPFGSFGCGDGRMNLGVDARFELPQLRFFDACRKRAAQRGEGIAHLPLLELFFTAIAHALVFAGTDVTAEPIGCDLDAARTFTGADLGNDALERLQQERGVVSIVLLERYSERLRALGKLGNRL